MVGSGARPNPGADAPPLVDAAYDECDEFATLCFDTARGPPEAFHAAYVAAHPEVSVSSFCDEPGMELAGHP